MSEASTRGIRGVLLDTQVTFTITEVCRACGADQTMVIRLVDEGVIDAIGHSPDWRFHGEALLRARRAIRLIDDLGVNLAGAALALDLLEKLEQIEALDIADSRGPAAH